MPGPPPGGTPVSRRAIGEVGLTGEVRAVSYADRRINEAKKMGFERCIIPKSNLKGNEDIKDIELIPVTTVREAIQILQSK